MDSVIGVNCLVNVIHNKDDKGRVWANVASITPLVKGMVKMAASPDYVKERDREKKADNTTPAGDDREDPSWTPF